MNPTPIPHPWQELQKLAGEEITRINPLELGRPFRLTDDQRIKLQPFIQAAGDNGAVLLVCSHSAFENCMTCRPIAITAQNRKTLSACLTRFTKNS